MMEEKEKQLRPGELTLALSGQGVDWYLQRLVAMVNSLSIEFGLTLFVEGAIVSGRLVGGKKYFETFAQEFAGSYPGDDDSKESMREAFASNADIYTDREDDDRPPPQFIHLIDSRCFSPGGNFLPSRGTLWRGRINAVSGFSLGQLELEGS